MAITTVGEFTDRFEQARCGLPGCGADLWLEQRTGTPIYLSDTVEMLMGADRICTATWEVVCENGHTILLPPDTAGDIYTFGDSGDDDIPFDDIARLRQVVATTERGDKP